MKSGAPGSLVGTFPLEDPDRSEAPVTDRPIRRWLPISSQWQRESLRTTLWVIPAVEVAFVFVLFVVTYILDQAAYHGDITFPAWVNNGSADAARQTLIGIAAAVITVVGLVFSITIVALTLASTQFGPRMLRNFIRDRGVQVTLGTFVATFVYAVLALGSVAHGSPEFVPHLSITVALVLVLVDLVVLIYFIDHVAKMIQLPQVIAGIGKDLSEAVRAEVVIGDRRPAPVLEAGPSPAELLQRIIESGATIRAKRSGYLQYFSYTSLVDIATGSGGVIHLLHRPGHFLVEGLPLANVWPADAAPTVGRALHDAHATGAHRTLSQDLSFAIDQLVEIAIRALSPAVNDTFTAITCIDWLSDGLCKISASWNPQRSYRDKQGYVRLLTAEPSYDRLVDRSFDKIRQAGRGMPAVLIRQLDALGRVMEHTTTHEQRATLMRQAERIMRASYESIPEPDDRADVARRYRELEVTEDRVAVGLGIATLLAAGYELEAGAPAITADGRTAR
jgi:uncharacterized membrane protein